MKSNRSVSFLLLSAALVCVIVSMSSIALAQGGNNISGFVYGLNRQPMADVIVELQNENYTTIQRTRTDNSGGYKFYGAPGGRLRIRVDPYGTDYERQEKDFEISNFTRDNGTRFSGFSTERQDIFLRLRKGVTPEMVTGTIFVQEIPQDAKKLYDQAISDLGAKKEKEGLAGLRTALEVFPKYYNALERLGTEYVRLGHYDAAQILLALAVEVNPKGFKSWYGLAYARYSRKHYTSALAAAEKAAEISPTEPLNKFLIGALLRQTGKLVESERALIQAKDASNDSIPLVHWELALLYANSLKRYADAARELKAFLKAQPDTNDAEMIKKLIADLEAKAGKSEE